MTAASLSPVNFRADSSGSKIGAASKTGQDFGFRKEFESAMPADHAPEPEPQPRDTSLKGRKPSERPDTKVAKRAAEDEAKPVLAGQTTVEPETAKPSLSREIGQDGTEAEASENVTGEVPDSSAATAPLLEGPRNSLTGAPGLTGGSVSPLALAVPLTPVKANAGARTGAETASPPEAGPAEVGKAWAISAPILQEAAPGTELASARDDMPSSASSPATAADGSVAFALRLKTVHGPRVDESAAQAPEESGLSRTVDVKNHPGSQNPKPAKADAMGEEGRRLGSAPERPSGLAATAAGAATEPAEISPGLPAATDAGQRPAAESQTPVASASRAPESPIRVSPSKAEGPVRTAAEALRNSDVAVPHARGASTEPARELSFRLERNQGIDSAVTVKIAERGGEVRVAVRSADETVANSLRNNLDGLIRGLDGHGFQTERWVPPQALASNLSGQPDQGQPRDQDLSRQRDPDSRQEARQDGQGERGRNGSGSGDQRQSRPRWLEELERMRA
ncbi:MAG: hypothetical protein EXQ52_16215 [Bryobacterales bacterium]|nr:hypothetical protein [Bryobacterales bacterium]